MLGAIWSDIQLAGANPPFVDVGKSPFFFARFSWWDSVRPLVNRVDCQMTVTSFSAKESCSFSLPGELGDSCSHICRTKPFAVSSHKLALPFARAPDRFSAPTAHLDPRFWILYLPAQAGSELDNHVLEWRGVGRGLFLNYTPPP